MTIMMKSTTEQLKIEAHLNMISKHGREREIVSAGENLRINYKNAKSRSSTAKQPQNRQEGINKGG